MKEKTKILFLGRAVTDYLPDMVLHGLYFLPNIELTNYPKTDFMYMDTFENIKKARIYGMGFTIFGTLPVYRGPYEENDILEKVKKNYFDYIILPYVSARTSMYVAEIHPLVKEVIKYYDKKQIAVIEGHDEVAYFVDEAFDYGTYFKRELYGNFRNKTMYPISFAFPEEKIQTSLPKTRAQAKMKPKPLGKKYRDYVYPYKTEQDYYDGYRESLFGLTYKKAGWDCMRHYEIMACRCLPYFTDIDGCPPEVCKTLPKGLIKEAVSMRGIYDDKMRYYATEQGHKEYHDLENKIFEHFQKHCTTRTLAEYVLAVMDSVK